MPNDLFNKLKRKSSKEIRKKYQKQEGLTAEELEQQKNQFLANIFSKIADHLPTFSWRVIYIALLYAIIVVGAYIYHIIGDEKKLYDVICNVIHNILVGMSALYVHTLKKK